MVGGAEIRTTRSRGRPQRGLALVKNAGKPNWHIQFYDEDRRATRRLSTGTADRREAERCLAVFKNPAAAFSSSVTDRSPTDVEIEPFSAPISAPVTDQSQTSGGETRQIDLPEAIKSYNLELCKRVRGARNSAGLSQSQVARELRVGVQSYIHWENRTPMPHCLIAAFAKVVGTDLNFLLMEPESDVVVPLPRPH